VTRADVREMLQAAAELQLAPTLAIVPLEQANDALATLRAGTGIRGATVLRVSA
jgi:D-arabinose 1-dehydrogenase-like Zn-dependent alcohol dehydrogenase